MASDTPGTLAHRERLSLADDFVSFGPDAPTVLEDWNASELLEHLIVREQRPDLMVGPRIPVSVIADRSVQALQRLQAKTWAERVDLFRSGPPAISPFALLDTQANTIEYLVHHEDLLRARPGWEPRVLEPADDEEIWRRLSFMSKVLVRADVDITLVSQIGGIRVGAKDPVGSVRVYGSPTELTLWAFGRDRVAKVRLEGEPESLFALREGSRGV